MNEQELPPDTRLEIMKFLNTEISKYVDRGLYINVAEITTKIATAIVAKDPTISMTRILNFPPLNRLITFEQKLTALIKAYLSVNQVTTVYELESEICAAFEITEFKALGYGFLSRHPIVAAEFKLTKNVAQTEIVTVADVYSAYERFYSAGIQNILHDNKKLSQNIVNTRYSLQAFVAFLENEYKKPFNALGIRLADFFEFHNLIANQVTTSYMKLNTALLKLTKEREKRMQKAKSQWSNKDTMKWADIIAQVSAYYKTSNAKRLELLGATNIFQKWNSSCSTKSFFIAIVHMVLSHKTHMTPFVIKAAALLIYWEYKIPEKLAKLDEFISSYTPEDRNQINSWIVKIRNGNWRFSDLYRYLSQAFTKKMNTKDKNDGSNFNAKCFMYQLLGRVFVASFVPDIPFQVEELDRLNPTRIKDAKLRMPAIFRTVYEKLISKNNNADLITLQKEIEDEFGGTPFEQISDITFLEGIKSLLPQIDISLRPASILPVNGEKNYVEMIADFITKDDVSNPPSSPEQLIGRLEALENTLNSGITKTISILQNHFPDYLSSLLSSLKTRNAHEMPDIHRIPFSELKSVIKQFLLSLDNNNENIANSKINEYHERIAFLIKEYFEISVEDLGFGQVTDIMSAISTNEEELGEEMIADLEIPAFASLPNPYIEMDVDQIIERISNVPCLRDIGTVLPWSWLSTSSLHDFISSFRSRIDAKCEELEKKLINNGYRRYMLIPRSKTIEEYFDAFKRRDSYETACCISALLHSARNSQKFIYAVMKDHFRSFIRGQSSQKEFQETITFVFDVMRDFPIIVGAAVFKNVFESPLIETKRDYVSVAAKYHDILLVRRLGTILGISPLANATAKSVDMEVDRTEKRLAPERGLRVVHNYKKVPDELMEEETEIKDKNDVNHSFDTSNSLQIVESIRKEEFGIGAKLDHEGQVIMKNHFERNRRALQRLSNELYSQDAHFVLELLQNADDNEYSGRVEAALKFVIDESSIIVLNNEIGFSEANIRALCDVGNSTKKNAAVQYIGQKGIGFKSVFRITDYPEIHSRGFHIRFDSTNYIVPEWIGADSLGNDILDGNWNTIIKLPFSEKILSKGLHLLLSKFEDIKPEVMLFLKKIKSLEIYDKMSTTLKSYKKITKDDGMVWLVSNDERTEKWFLIKCSITIPEHIKSQNTLAKAAELSAAFSMDYIDEDGGLVENASSYQPFQHDVFAFLPLRNYGFKFIINGDFYVPSSREDVDHDSTWNQWLSSQIPELFQVSFYEFKKRWSSLEIPEQAKHLSIFMKFVPRRSEIHGFFRTAVDGILEKMKETECILTASGECVKPSQVLQIPDSIENEFNEEFKKSYVFSNKYEMHPDLVVEPKLASSLGVVTMNAELLLRIIRTVSQSSNNYVSSLLSAFVTLLETETATTQKFLIEELKSLPVFRIVGEPTLKSLNRNLLYFYIGHSKSDNILLNGDIFKFITRIRILDLSLIGLDHAYCIKLYNKLGVKPINEDDIALQFIMSEILSGPKFSRNELIEVAYFLALYDAGRTNISDPTFFEKLKKNLLFGTNRDTFVTAESHLHLPESLGGKLVDNTSFFTTISADYEIWALNFGSDDNLRNSIKQSLIKFLKKLGITGYLRIEPVTLSDNVDYKSPEFESLLETHDKLLSLLSEDASESNIDKYLHHTQGLLQVLYHLSENWLYYVKNYCFMKTSNGKPTTEHSSFYRNLRIKKWIPTSSANLAAPSDIYIKSPQLFDLFGDLDIFELTAFSALNSQFVSDIGFQTKPGPEDLLAAVEYWNQHGTEQFNLTAESVDYLYNCVNSYAKVFNETMTSVPIFVPINGTFRIESKELGYFIKPSDCVLRDPDYILSGWHFDSNGVLNNKVVVQLLYEGMEALRKISELGQVPKHPHLNDYLSYLANLQRENLHVATSSLFDTVSKMMKRFAIDSIIEEFKKMTFSFPSHHKEMVDSRNLFIVDDILLGNLFSSAAEIHFLGTPHPQTTEEFVIPSNEAIEFFYKCGMRKLSMVAQYTPIPAGRFISPPSERSTKLAIGAFFKMLKISSSISTFDIIFSELLSFKIQVANTIRKSNRTHHLVHDKMKNKFTIYLARLSFHALGNLFHEFGKMLGVNYDLEKIRVYFNNLGPLCIHDEILFQQLSVDGMIDDSLRAEFKYIEDDSDEEEDEPYDLNNRESYAQQEGSLKRILADDTTITKPVKRRAINDEGGDYVLDRVYSSFLALNSENIQIPRGALKSLPSRNLAMPQELSATGRLGEEIAYLYLKKKYEDNPDVVVEWMNEFLEKGTQYDILIRTRNGDEVIQYVEVKATKMKWRPYFEISHLEWKFAQANPGKFCIYRVSDVKDEFKEEPILSFNIVKLENPVLLLKEGYMRMQYRMEMFPEKFVSPDQSHLQMDSQSNASHNSSLNNSHGQSSAPMNLSRSDWASDQSLLLSHNTASFLNSSHKSSDFVNLDDPNIKKDIVKMIIQFLTDEGYSLSKNTLIEESALKSHENEEIVAEVVKMKQAILDGNWQEVDRLSPKIFSRNHKGFLYAIYKQQYLEYIDSHDQQKALAHLTKRIKPLEGQAPTKSEFRDLCYLLTARSVRDVPSFRDWEGVPVSREKLAEKFRCLYEFDSLDSKGDFHVPPNRLTTLLSQAMAHQIEKSKSRFHTTALPKFKTLLYDYNPVLVPNSLHKTLAGHTANIKCVDFVGQCGDYIVSGSSDSTCRIWNSDTGECTAVLEGHSSRVWDVSSEKSGQFIASASADKTLKIWNVSSRKCVSTLTGNEGDVYSVKYHPTGTRIISGGYDKIVRLYDIEKETLLSEFRGHTLSVSKSIFNTHSNTLVSCSKDCTIKLWDPTSGLCIKTISTHLGEVSSIEMCENGRYLLSSSKDNSNRLWDMRMLKPVKRYKGHQNTSKNFVRAGFATESLVIGGSEDGIVHVWDTETGDILQRLKGHSGIAYSVVYNIEKSSFASCGEDCTVRIWKFEEERSTM